MRTLTIHRKKHFIDSSADYTLTVCDDIGMRRIRLKNGQTAAIPVSDGDIRLKIGVNGAYGYSESEEITAPAGGNMSYKIETGYSIYFGPNYTIKRTDK